MVCKKLKKNQFSDSWLSSIAGNKLFAWFSSPPNGRSGGLLVGFNSEVFDVREHEAGEFMIHTLVLHRETNFIWNFVNVYGAAQKDHKNRFLSELSSFCLRSQVPLLIGGDFNIIRKAEEKNKPGGFNRWSSLFNSIIDQYGLVEFDLKTDCTLGLIIVVSLPLRSWTDSWPAQIGTLLTIISVFMV